MDIKEIILCSGNPGDLKNFYIDKLGFKLKTGNDDEFSFKAGKTLITFKKSNSKNKPFYHFAFNIPSNKFTEAKEWIKSNNIELISLNGEVEFDFKSWNAHSFYFYDASENIVEFIVRHNLRNESDEKFTAVSIINVSEIGLPVKDVRETFTLINNKFNIPHFSGDMKTFEAAGDENGLFIIVNEGRRWFPDCQDAEIFPLTIKINSEFKGEIIFEINNYRIIS